MKNVTKLSIIAIIIIILELTYIIIDYNKQIFRQTSQYYTTTANKSKFSTKIVDREKIRETIKVAEENCQRLMDSTNYEEMVSIVNVWKKEISSGLQVEIRLELQRRIKSRKELKLEYKDDTIRQDISIEGGRALWALEILLDYEFPTISKESNDLELEKIYYTVSRVMSEKWEQKRIAKIGDLKSLSVERKIELAKDVDTPFKIFEELSSDSSVKVRIAIAANLRVPFSIRKRLSEEDPDTEVRKVAKENLYLGGSFYRD